VRLHWKMEATRGAGESLVVKEPLRLLVRFRLLEHPVVTAVGDFDHERQIGFSEAVRAMPVACVVAIDACERDVEPRMAIAIGVGPDRTDDATHANLVNGSIAVALAVLSRCGWLGRLDRLFVPASFVSRWCGRTHGIPAFQSVWNVNQKNRIAPRVAPDSDLSATANAFNF
jgi:hypothetical protein